MKVLITGGDGQLARELRSRAPDGVELLSLARTECDIADPEAVREKISISRPDFVINCAAYTAVDAAEQYPTRAFAINAAGARNVAEATLAIRARLIHISTDYVFDGARTNPYPPDAKPNPLNVYGASKLEGESEVFRVSSNAIVVRTGWLYSVHGTNFLLTMLTAMRRNGTVRVVTDQTGGPTSAGHLADALWACVRKNVEGGLYHWSNAGSATWYEFALAIASLGEACGVLSPVDVVPTTTAEMRRPAKRPAYSVLDSTRLAMTLDMSPKPWRSSVEDAMREISSA